MSRVPQQNVPRQANRTPFLYRAAARLLIWFMVFQPVYVALGMELDEGTQAPPPQSETPQATTPEADTQPATEVVEDATTPSEQDVSDGGIETETEDTIVADVADAETDTEISDEYGADETVEQTEEESSVETETNNQLTDEETTEENPEESDINEEPQDDTNTGGGGGVATEDDDTTTGAEDIPSDEESITEVDEAEEGDTTGDEVATETTEGEESETATTSDDVVVPEETEVPQVIATTVQDQQNAYVFADGDCTLVADGEFYCVRSDTPRIETGDPRVYAEKDRDGDREIYYFDGVEVQKITNNAYDDFAPVFEEETLRIVWQAMIHDRLQIMMYDIPDKTTRQITSSRQNSSNPDIKGDTVVWQEWVDTNWEIMITDVDTGGQPFEVERLTDNAVHDMFPQAYDDLITWQREKGASWEVVVYDLRTGKQTTLEKNEDTKYENPRFVLLFDSRHENGDVETIGYDLDTGEMMELGTRSVPIPEEPKSPKDETQDAIPREATSTAQLKPVKDDDDGSTDI